MTIEPPTNPVLDAIYRRHATRAYLPDRVSRAVIETLLDAAVHAPTAMHLEPWAFVVVQDRELLKRLSDRSKELARTLPAGSAHPTLARSSSKVPAVLEDPAFDIFYGAGTLVVICSPSFGPFVAADCWLAAENLMLAATALGHATCPIGFALPGLADPEMRGVLGIPSEVAAYAPIIVGLPAGSPTVQSRRAPRILTWIE